MAILNRLIAISLLGFAFHSLAQAPEKFLLWQEQTPPYYKENELVETEKEAWGTRVVTDVTGAELTIFPALGENSGAAVLILPGGGYTVQAIYHEGYDVARALSEFGVTGVVLKYRLPNPKSSAHPERVPLSDVRKALSVLREKSSQYGLEPDKIGVMGFSAGSHLATVNSLWTSENQAENPSFSALIYGVTRLTGENLIWLEESLYHRKLTDKEIKQNTLLALVNDTTPPAFLVHAYDDQTCDVRESTEYAEILRLHNVPVEMHLYQTGGHGFGLGSESDGTITWLPLFVNWLTRL